mmetsp:Transcript_70721/g.199695  ORF Transcript_70721/g.199695 Transcript_70721/m.199695 type:complete len:359 (+) Transcript_70721:697-1773(+)
MPTQRLPVPSSTCLSQSTPKSSTPWTACLAKSYVTGPTRTDPTERLKHSTVTPWRQSALSLRAPVRGPLVTIAAYMPLRSRLRALLTASCTSGKTMRRRLGSPNAANGGETSGLPIVGWSFAQKLSIRHCTRVQPASGTQMDRPCGRLSGGAAGAAAEGFGSCAALGLGSGAFGSEYSLSSRGTSIFFGLASIRGFASAAGLRDSGASGCRPGDSSGSSSATSERPDPSAASGDGRGTRSGDARDGSSARDGGAAARLLGSTTSFWCPHPSTTGYGESAPSCSPSPSVASPSSSNSPPAAHQWGSHWAYASHCSAPWTAEGLVAPCQGMYASAPHSGQASRFIARCSTVHWLTSPQGA